MSRYARDQVNANSGFVVSVSPEDFKFEGPLGGVEFQRSLEQAAFRIGCSSAPIQRLEDYRIGRPSKRIGDIKPSYTGKTALSDLNLIFPEYINTLLIKASYDFDRKLKGFAAPDAILTGVETRTSSPVRITRDETYQSVSCRGLYPCGEGPGYAGGIMSAAVDGITVANVIVSKYSLP